MPKPRRRRASKLDPFIEYMDLRLSEGLENCVVLSRELQGLGYQGGYLLVKTYVSPRRRRRQVQATVRFETEPGEQAQVDWGSFSYVDERGRKRRMWPFVMVLSWSRAIYVEFVRRADTASFIQCHVNAFDCLGGVPSDACMTIPIIQSTPKATVFVGSGIVSLVDYQRPIRWRGVGPFGSPTPTSGGANPGTTRISGSRSRSTRDASLPSRLGGSNDGKLWCSLDCDLDGPRTDRPGCCLNSHHLDSQG